MKNFPFYLIILLVFMALSNELWSEGMHLDGVWYAAIAKNLSNGFGSFWYLPSVDSSGVFHGHPPLAIGLQSIFFSIFGDSIYIERAFSLLTFLITGFFIHLTWKEVMGKKYSFYSWVVLLFWALTPLNSWACSNNLLENTMNIFVASSVFFLIKNIRTDNLSYIIISGVCLFLAFLSKGFTGLFPLSFFFLYFLVFSSMKFKDMIGKTLLLIAFTLIPFLLLYVFYPPAIDSLSEYINFQVVYSLKNVQTTNNRFSIINALFNQLKFIHILGSISILSFIVFIFREQMLSLVLRFKIFFITIIILAISYFILELYIDTGIRSAINSINFTSIIYYISFGFPVMLLFFLIYISRNNVQLDLISSERRRWIILFIFLGFSGVLPMIISLRQGGFYILTALPYFIISFVILILPILNYILNKFGVKRKIIYLFMVPLFILYGPFVSYSTVITIPYIASWKLSSLKYQCESTGRDKHLIDDIKLIMREIPENTKVNIDFHKHYIIHAYFARYDNISLDTDLRNRHEYLISFEDGWSYGVANYLEEDTDLQKVRRKYKKDYKKIKLNTNKLHLYMHKK